MQAVYYRDRQGVEPVNDFINGLALERQEEFDYKISLLNRLGTNDPPLPFPHSSQVVVLSKLISSVHGTSLLIFESGQPSRQHSR